MQDLGMLPMVCTSATPDEAAMSGQQVAVIAWGVAAAVLAAVLALMLVVYYKRRTAGKARPHGKPLVRPRPLPLRLYMNMAAN
jgi:hypothetical protein